MIIMIYQSKINKQLLTRLQKFNHAVVFFMYSHLGKGVRFLELRDRVGTHIVSHFLPSLYCSLDQPLQQM